MFSFPESLPPADTSSAFSQLPNHITTTIPGLTIEGRIGTSELISRSFYLEYTLNDEQLEDFMTWYEDILEYGHRFFSLQIADTTHVAKFVSGYELESQSPNNNNWKLRFRTYTKEGELPVLDLTPVDSEFLDFCDEMPAIINCTNMWQYVDVQP